MAYENVIQGLAQIPWVAIFWITVELGIVVIGGLFWFRRVVLNPIQAHIALKRGTTIMWIKKGARIVTTPQGTRELAILGHKKKMPCPDLKYFYINKTMFFCRQQRIYLREDNVGDLHASEMGDFGQDFVPEDQNMKLFYVNSAAHEEFLYGKKVGFFEKHFTAIAGLMTVVVCLVMLVVISSQLKDMFIQTSQMLAGAMNNVASAMSQYRPPV
jgi:hypothetical protein